MKIAFLCPSLDPGRDGVGDYARRLAGELFRQDHSCVIVGLNDPKVREPIIEIQEIDGLAVSVLRLPNLMSWKKRETVVQQWLAKFNPDWISLQFVPFGFHPKGLCFGLGSRLAAMNPKATWHIMFHELWLGLGEHSPLKHRVIGALQRHIVLDCVKRLRPRVINTQADVYQTVLVREKIKASILPLFGNIPFVQGDGWNELLKPLVAEAIGKDLKRSELYLAGILGAVHPEWNAELAVQALLPLVQQFNKRLVLVFHGKNNLSLEVFQNLKSSLQGRADVVVAGERSSLEISKILQTLDLGLATSPHQMIQKSGSVAAMLEHGLQILVIRDDWHLRGADTLLKKESPDIFPIKQFALLKSLPTRNVQLPRESSVKHVADQMLADLQPSISGLAPSAS